MTQYYDVTAAEFCACVFMRSKFIFCNNKDQNGKYAANASLLLFNMIGSGLLELTGNITMPYFPFQRLIPVRKINAVLDGKLALNSPCFPLTNCCLQ